MHAVLRTTRTPLIAFALALLAAFAIVASATGASAHAAWLSTSPEAGGTVDVAPSEVRVTFDSGLLDSGAALVVTNADGVVISEPTPVIDRTEISVAVDPGAPAGVYTVAFRVVSEDGHTVSESFDYTVAQSASVAPNASAAPVADAPSADATIAPAAPPSASPVAQPEAAAQVQAEPESSSGGVPVWVWIVAAVGLIAIAIVVASRRRRV